MKIGNGWMNPHYFPNDLFSCSFLIENLLYLKYSYTTFFQNLCSAMKFVIKCNKCDFFQFSITHKIDIS